MKHLIAEIASHQAYISARRGLLDVVIDGEKQAAIPIEDLAAVVITGRGVTFTIGALERLGEQGAPVVCCGRQFRPSSIVWPSAPSSINSRRIRCQIEASLPKAKAAWKSIVSAKIRWQAAVLQDQEKPFLVVKKLATKVRSGDPSNVEAQAARHYWKLLFGQNFRRDRNSPGLNAALNYGYAIVRAATARGIAAAGLHPAIAVMHRNAHNSFGLVDDLMEPFRPLVDRWVFANKERIDDTDLDKETKKQLAGLLHNQVMSTGSTPLMTLIYQTATNFGKYLEQGGELILPDPSRSSLYENEEMECFEWIQSDVDASYV